MLDTLSTLLSGFVCLMAARLLVLGQPGLGCRYAAVERRVLVAAAAPVAAVLARG
jgi:hypothetical protein